MGDVDEEFEGEAEAVFDEASGEKNGLSVAEGGVAMAYGAVAQLDGKGGGDQVLAGVRDGKGNEVVGALTERGSSGAGTAATRRSRSESGTRVSPQLA